jgi:8-oxo-dGTP pyrophosphatase MutT (NUDIX family)
VKKFFNPPPTSAAVPVAPARTHPLPLTLPTGFTISFEEIVKIYQGAGVFMMRWNNGVLEALVPLEKRSGEGSGIKVGVFGGRRDHHEFDPFGTACRELVEETAGLISFDQAAHMMLQGGIMTAASIYLPFGKYMMFIVCLPSGSFNNVMELYREQSRNVKGAEASFISWVPFEDILTSWKSNVLAIQVRVFRHTKGDYEVLTIPFSGMLKKTLNIVEFHALVTTTSQSRREQESIIPIVKV